MLFHFRQNRFHIRLPGSVPFLLLVAFILTACGDTGESIETTPSSTPSEQSTEVQSATQTEKSNAESSDSTTTPASASPTEIDELTPESSETETADDIDLAPEIGPFDDWRHGEPVTLEDLRGEPVMLVFWSSI